MAQIAVIDVETTGLNPYRSDRIVEIGIVVIDDEGNRVSEFTSLINPERDVGPTRIHGITSSDVSVAPTFRAIAGAILQRLSGCVALAAHNVRFDYSFLDSEFSRIGCSLGDIPKLCTMELAGGGSLSATCEEYGIAFQGDAHDALNDVRATAMLLKSLLTDAPKLRSDIASRPPIEWPAVPVPSTSPMTRAESQRLSAGPPTYLERLIHRIPPEIPIHEDGSAHLAYSALLERVLMDRHIDDAEGAALLDLAVRWHISPKAILELHNGFLFRLAIAALADGIVTDSERKDLHKVAQLLGVDSRNLDLLLVDAYDKLQFRSSNAPVSNTLGSATPLSGRRVCFTGEGSCRFRGELISRSLATTLAERKGIIILESVTKQLDLLVVADPLTQSGKARKARQYGIPVMQEIVFWKHIGVEVE